MIEQLMQYARQHGLDAGEWEHEIGDLQELLGQLWKTAGPEQRLAFLESPAVLRVVEAGGYADGTAQLVVAIQEMREQCQWIKRPKSKTTKTESKPDDS